VVTPHERFLEQIRRLLPLLKGSLAEVQLTCGTRTCRCHAEGPKHRGYYLSYRLHGESRTVYVPQGALREVRRAHANWLTMKKALEEHTARTVAELLRRTPRRAGGRKERRR
jgi:hypothetical protein